MAILPEESNHIHVKLNMRELSLGQEAVIHEDHRLGVDLCNDIGPGVCVCDQVVSVLEWLVG